jgi:hypothetical protein
VSLLASAADPAQACIHLTYPHCTTDAAIEASGPPGALACRSCRPCCAQQGHPEGTPRCSGPLDQPQHAIRTASTVPLCPQCAYDGQKASCSGMGRRLLGWSVSNAWVPALMGLWLTTWHLASCHTPRRHSISIRPYLPLAPFLLPAHTATLSHPRPHTHTPTPIKSLGVLKASHAERRRWRL